MEFQPRINPGKTAPRFIRDLLDYDPRRARQEGKNFNVFTDPAPIYRKNGKLLPLRMLPQDCQHRLFRKELQTVIPLVDQKPSTSSQYISSSYCAHCLYHFDVVIDYTRRPGRETPCELGTHFPLHHLQHCQTRKGTAGEKEKRFDKYEDYREAHTFACSAPNCPALVDVRISPPRLSKEYLSLLWDPAKVSRRGQKAIQEQPDRYQNAHPLHPSEVMTVMRTYLCDALNKSPTDKKRIAIRNKKFLLAFSDECDAVFEYLDFERETETSADGEGQDKYWVLPSVNPPDPNEFATPGRRQFLEDVVFELSERIAGGPDKNSVVAPGRYVYQPVPAAKDIEATLGCFGYTKVGSRTVINLEESEHPHYAGLGALEDFADELIVFAYERQRECDSRNSPYYLECLQGIAAGRNSDELQEKSVIAVSMGEHTLSEIEDAYKFLTVDPNTDFGDEHIIGLYRSRIDAAPRQKEEARQCLLIIGQARQSEMILAVANDKAMSVDEALEYLSVTHDTPSDSIEAAAVVLSMDGDKSKVARAVRVIGEHRQQYALEIFANQIESGDSSGATTLAEAYRRLQINDSNLGDEGVMNYYRTLCATAAAGSKASYTEALRTIAIARNSATLKAFADNPDGPIEVEKGSEDKPVGLDNIGNTCYLNSLLQYYYTVKPVRDIVMNFSDYRMDINTENMLKKRVGGRAVAKGEIVKAQRFVEELRELFTNLKSASTQSVRPTQDLAELTLFSAATEANFRRQSVSSPEAPRFSSSLDAPVFCPELPPPPPLRPSPTPIVSERDIPEDDIEMVDRPSQDALSQDDADSDTTLVDLDPQATKDAVFDNTLNMRDVAFSEPAENGTEVNGEKSEHLLVSTTTDKEATPSPPSHLAQSDNADSQGDEIMVNGATTTLQSEVRPSTPEKPPPVPPRNKPAPIQTSAESEESLRAQKLNFGAQQDVTEVIGNVMFRLQCAIKPTSIDPKFGEQIDKIRETFYGANAVYLKKAENYDVKIEDWANIIVFPSRDGPRTIYEALDVVFDEQVVEIDNALTTQHASISKLPPIFQTQIQRTDYDPQRQQATKNQNPILFEETIYLDRYMDSDKVMQRRKEAWKWKSRIRKLEARQKVLQDKQDGIDVPEALNATKLFLRKLEAEEIDGVSVNPSLSEAIEERRVEIVRELDAINEEISNLKKRLQDQFTDMREHRYSLQAVFIHRGTTNYGHYWIYIYDFERDIWREYNDERVSVVNDRKQIFEQRPNGPTPYYLVYVRDQDKSELVDAVCRKIEEEPETAPSAVAVNGSSALDLDEEPTSQHIEDVSLVEPARAHDLTDLAGMGSWDHSAPGDDDGRQW